VSHPQHGNVPHGPADPWAGDSITFGYPQVGGAQQFEQPYDAVAGDGSPVHRRSRALIVISIAVVVSLVLGGVALAGAYVWYGWGTTQPEAVLPGSASVFARIDLSPGLGQQLKLNSLAEKFPKDGKSTEDFVEQIKRDLVEELGLSPLTYDADIKPWFDERIGIAIWSTDNSARGVCALVAMASSDDAAAGTALAKVREKKGADDFGFAFNDGYAVLAECRGSADSQVAADAAVADAKTQSLANRPAFADALADLPSGQTAVGWADLAKATELLPRVMNDAAAGAGAGTGSGTVTGEIIVGLLATNDGVDLRYRLRGGEAMSTAKDVLAELGALPGNTAIGVSADLTGSGTAAKELEKSFGGAGGGGPFAEFGDGIEAILGSVLSVSITDVSDDIALRVVARAASAEKASHIAAMFDLLSSEPGGLPQGVTVDTSGETVTVTTRGYSADGGKLADSALYRDAMDGATGTSVMAGFVNVEMLAPSLDLSAKEAANLRPVKAIGVSTGYADGALVGLVRVIIR